MVLQLRNLLHAEGLAEVLPGVQGQAAGEGTALLGLRVGLLVRGVQRRELVLLQVVRQLRQWLAGLALLHGVLLLLLLRLWRGLMLLLLLCLMLPQGAHHVWPGVVVPARCCCLLGAEGQ